METLIIVENGADVYGVCADWSQAANPVFWYDGEELFQSAKHVADFGYDYFAALEDLLTDVAQHHNFDKKWINDMLSRRSYYFYVTNGFPRWVELKQDAKHIIKLGLFKDKLYSAFTKREKALQLALDLREFKIDVQSLDLNELKNFIEEYKLSSKYKS